MSNFREIVRKNKWDPGTPDKGVTKSRQNNKLGDEQKKAAAAAQKANGSSLMNSLNLRKTIG